MKKLILHLPKYRLMVQYRVIKRRKSSLDEPLIPTTKLLNLKYRVGGHTKKLFRYLFEHKKIKAILGSNIAFMLVASSFIPNYALGQNTNTETRVIEASINPIKTNVSVQFPVEKVSITQGYKIYHPGIDFDGLTGDSIMPMKAGRVVSVEYSNFAYGNHVIIDHGNNLTSLYAHLSKIEVKQGQEVTTEDEIGKMGATGRATGDHLHFEVRDHGIPVNPLTILSR